MTLNLKRILALFIILTLTSTTLSVVADDFYVDAASKFKITFKANGGKVSKKTKSVKYRKKYGKLPTATRAGYKFDGWYTKKNGGKKVTAKTKVKRSTKHKLYAHWKKKVTVTFKNSLHGDVIQQKTYVYGSEYGTMPTPKLQSGKKVKGWYAYEMGDTVYSVSEDSKIETKNNHVLYPEYTYATGLHAQEALEIFKLVNIERAKAGVEPLQFSTRIKKSTDIRAKEISEFFSHTRPNNEICFSLDPTILHGENIAAGQGDAYFVMHSWMNSPGHRANILDPNYKSIGISMYYAEGDSMGFYYVQCFSGHKVE